MAIMDVMAIAAVMPILTKIARMATRLEVDFVLPLSKQQEQE